MSARDKRAMLPRVGGRALRRPAGSESHGAMGTGVGYGRRIVESYGLVFVLVVLVAVVGVAEPSFVGTQNLLNLLHQWAPVGLMAAAGTFVIIAGGFDFSVGGIFALAAVLAAGMAQDMPIEIAFLLTSLAGVAMGLLNGLVVTKMHVNPFIATLGTGQIFRGIALVYTGAVPFIVLDESFGSLGRSKIGSMPVAGIILIAVFIVGGIILARSVYGRSVFAIGGNRDASILSGLRADRILITTYMLSGLAAAFAGMVVASRIGEGQANLGASPPVEFDVVIAIVLGGTAISGGAGAMWRTVVGLALLATMQNGFDTLQVNPFWQVVIKGSILVAAVAWDEFVSRKKASAAVRTFEPAPVAVGVRTGEPPPSARDPSG